MLAISPTKRESKFRRGNGSARLRQVSPDEIQEISGRRIRKRHLAGKTQDCSVDQTSRELLNELLKAELRQLRIRNLAAEEKLTEDARANERNEQSPSRAAEGKQIVTEARMPTLISSVCYQRAIVSFSDVSFEQFRLRTNPSIGAFTVQEGMPSRLGRIAARLKIHTAALSPSNTQLNQ